MTPPPPRLQVPFATLRALPVDNDDLYSMIEREEAVLTHVVPAHLLRCFRAAAGEEVDGATALYAAAREGCEDVVRVLLAAGADHEQAEQGATPLFVAAARGHDQLLEPTT